MRKPNVLLLFALILFTAIHLETAAQAAKKTTCVACTVPGLDVRSSVPLAAATKTSGCKLRRGISGIAMQDPDCTPGAINQSVTIDVIRNEKFHAACVNSCLTSDSEKTEIYSRYGVEPDPATCELDHLVPLELGGADSLDNIWPQCGPVEAQGLKIHFKEKDKVESYFTTLVKTGKMPLREAQQAIAKDWTQYRDTALAFCAANKCALDQ
jgi:hypothetical protein